MSTPTNLILLKPLRRRTWEECLGAALITLSLAERMVISLRDRTVEKTYERLTKKPADR